MMGASLAISRLGLSESQKRAVIGVLFDGRTARAVGAAEGVSRKAILQRLRRARRRAAAAGVAIPVPAPIRLVPMSEFRRAA